MTKRIVAGILTALLFVAAYFQLDDPDSAQWIGIYAAAGLLAAWFTAAPTTSRHRTIAALIVAAVAIAWALIGVLPSVIREGNMTGIEIERELGGLILVTGATAWIAFGATRPGKPSAD